MAADALDVRSAQIVDRHNIVGNNHVSNGCLNCDVCGGNRARNGTGCNNDAGNNGNDFDLRLGPTGIDAMDSTVGTIPSVDEIIDEILEGKIELPGFMTDPQCMEVIEEGIIEACSDRVVSFIRGLMGDDILSVDVAAIAFANLYLAHRATCDAEMDLYDAEMFAGNAIADVIDRDADLLGYDGFVPGEFRDFVDPGLLGMGCDRPHLHDGPMSEETYDDDPLYDYPFEDLCGNPHEDLYNDLYDDLYEDLYDDLYESLHEGSYDDPYGDFNENLYETIHEDAIDEDHTVDDGLFFEDLLFEDLYDEDSICDFDWHLFLLDGVRPHPDVPYTEGVLVERGPVGYDDQEYDYLEDDLEDNLEDDQEDEDPCYDCPYRLVIEMYGDPRFVRLPRIPGSKDCSSIEELDLEESRVERPIDPVDISDLLADHLAANPGRNVTVTIRSESPGHPMIEDIDDSNDSNDSDPLDDHVDSYDLGDSDHPLDPEGPIGPVELYDVDRSESEGPILGILRNDMLACGGDCDDCPFVGMTRYYHGADGKLRHFDVGITCKQIRSNGQSDAYQQSKGVCIRV